ncbi:hypothetical protein Nepgr_008498 [Nepenthes gracilis]|uniref:Sugar phosphate transporter domain-containing protein n=1 Tax=Nepenthes gracilis TaxID=150966 RepID=A0AAD3XJB6_NEPGR|nr:hypothetical protein Nepgr_008498 [Nepenthes gracilis]
MTSTKKRKEKALGASTKQNVVKTHKSVKKSTSCSNGRKHKVSTTTLTGLHFTATTLMTTSLQRLGYIETSHLPLSEVLKFVLFASFSIVGMNVSLMWNSVGFYQIAKLSMIRVTCLLEVVLDKKIYSRDTKLSIALVLLGVGICTVTDVSVNARGFITALVAVWSTSLQQYHVHRLRRKYSFGSFNLLEHTAPVQAVSLLVIGPFLDRSLTNRWLMVTTILFHGKCYTRYSLASFS